MPLSTVKPSWISPSACLHCIQKSTTCIDAQLLPGALDTLDYCREHLIRWYYSREHLVRCLHVGTTARSIWYVGTRFATPIVCPSGTYEAVSVSQRACTRRTDV